jgi:hypothetical protein
MFLRDAIRNLHGLGFPIYREGLPGYYVLDITQTLPKNRRDLKTLLSVHEVLLRAHKEGRITLHVDGEGFPAFVCIRPDFFKTELHDLERYALDFVRRTRTGLEFSNEVGQRFVVNRRSRLIKKLE